MLNESVILNATRTSTDVMTYWVEAEKSNPSTLMTGPVDQANNPSGDPTTLSDSVGLFVPQ